MTRDSVKVNVNKVNINKVNVNKIDFNKVNVNRVNVNKVNVNKVNVNKVNVNKVNVKVNVNKSTTWSTTPTLFIANTKETLKEAPRLEAAAHLLWRRPTAATFVVVMNRVDVVDHVVDVVDVDLDVDLVDVHLVDVDLIDVDVF